MNDVSALIPAEDKKRYYPWLRHLPVLTAEEERLLAERFVQTRDPALARLLVLGNLRFVFKMALSYRNDRFRLPDLVQEGVVGLLQAIQRFDPGRGVRLSSYAVFWIRSRMLHFIHAGLRHRVISGANREEEEEEMDLESPEDLFLKAEGARWVEKALTEAISRLNPREQWIIRRRYMSGSPRTRTAIGQELGISRERVRQIEEQAKEKMRKRLRELPPYHGFRRRRIRPK
jgi:RNA polymerase sigma factor (sigma-70 family)